MKKLVAILLSAAMLLGLCACGGTQYDEAVLGVYTCYAAEVMGTQMKADDVFEDICTIELKQGGKGTIHMDGKDYSLKFTLAGEVITVEADGETGGGSLKDGLMEVEIMDLKLLLAKEGVEVAVAASDAGYYILSTLSQGGETFDEAMIKEMGLYGTMYMVMNEDGTGYLCLGEGDITDLTWVQGSITADDETISYTLEGDALTIEVEGISMIFIRSNETPPAAPPAAPAEPAEPVEPVEEPQASIVEPLEPDTPAESDGSAISNEPVSADLGNYRITILGAEEFTDIDGKASIRFYYDFTNNTDDLDYPRFNLSYYASQDGYELVGCYSSMDDEAPENGNDVRKVIPGVTIRCVSEFNYKPDGGTLQFTIKDNNDNAVTMEFDPKNLPGRPEEYTLPPITAPTWTSGMSNEGVLDEKYYVKIDHYEKTTGYGDIPLLRVYFEFTNNSEEAASVFLATNLIALQDGAQLVTTLPLESLPEDDNYSMNVAPGETVMAAQCFALQGDSPVEVLLYEYFKKTTIGMVIPVA